MNRRKRWNAWWMSESDSTSGSVTTGCSSLSHIGHTYRSSTRDLPSSFSDTTPRSETRADGDPLHERSGSRSTERSDTYGQT
jgi:hypothetical protein